MNAMAQNMVWDGLFHSATLVLTLTGVRMLWSDGGGRGKLGVCRSSSDR